MAPCPAQTGELPVGAGFLFLPASKLSKTVRAGYHLPWWLPGEPLTIFVCCPHDRALERLRHGWSRRR